MICDQRRVRKENDKEEEKSKCKNKKKNTVPKWRREKSVTDREKVKNE